MIMNKLQNLIKKGIVLDKLFESITQKALYLNLHCKNEKN